MEKEKKQYEGKRYGITAIIISCLIYVGLFFLFIGNMMYAAVKKTPANVIFILFEIIFYAMGAIACVIPIFLPIIFIVKQFKNKDTKMRFISLGVYLGNIVVASIIFIVTFFLI